ncbi:MAG: creatininase family protein [Promethearchaeota archaeon]|jgi:creatinine amidohydrolase
MKEEVLYEKLTPAAFEARIKEASIAYLPIGTLEWHGPHLPLGSDHLQSQGFFIQLAQRVGGVVLPSLYLGPDIMKTVNDFEYYGMDILQKASPQPLQLTGSAYWVSEHLFSLIIDAILKQLKRVGFKILVAHGHGPSTNHIIDNTSELEQKHDLKIFTIWRSKGNRVHELEFQYDHAATNETSIMMALYPSLVHMNQLPQNQQEKPLGLIGKDPRIHASKKQGEDLILFHLKRMESLLKKEMRTLTGKR